MARSARSTAGSLYTQKTDEAQISRSLVVQRRKEKERDERDSRPSRSSSSLLSSSSTDSSESSKVRKDRNQSSKVIGGDSRSRLSAEDLLDEAQSNLRGFGMRNGSSDESENETPFGGRPELERRRGISFDHRARKGNEEGKEGSLDQARILLQNLCDSSHELLRNRVEDGTRETSEEVQSDVKLISQRGLRDKT